MAELGEKSTNHYSPTAWAPKAPPKKEGLANFIWNSDTSEFMGRTGSSWFKITLFYIIFYICLAIFFLVSLQIFLLTLEDTVPRRLLDDSLIGTNPGVGYRPMPDQETNTDSSLIWINRADEGKSSYWRNELKRFFRDYLKTDGTQACSFKNPDVDISDEPCEVNTHFMRTCNDSMNGFGYLTAAYQVRPCVLIKLNKIYNWTPEPYETVDELDEANKDEKKKMPSELYDYVRRLLVAAEDGDMASRNKTRTVWISCEGENPADKENIGVSKLFSPGMTEPFPGIPAYYFPYLNQPRYMAPFVFVQFQNLSPHTLINIKCQAWAKNIVPDNLNRAGLVHFELLID